MKSEYRKFTDQIAADTARAAPLSPSVRDFAWLDGEWLWHAERVRFSEAPYGVSIHSEEDPFLIYSVPTGMWILVLNDPEAYGMLIGMEMRRGQSRFTGDVNISGESVQLRQTWRRISDSVIEIQNERRADDTWQLLDRALLERVRPAN